MTLYSSDTSDFVKKYFQFLQSIGSNSADIIHSRSTKRRIVMLLSAQKYVIVGGYIISKYRGAF